MLTGGARPVSETRRKELVSFSVIRSLQGRCQMKTDVVISRFFNRICWSMSA